METVIIPAGTVVQINGIPVQLVVDTLVDTAHGNLSQLTGYHYGRRPEAPPEAPSSVA